jgi:hypothetical protein
VKIYRPPQKTPPLNRSPPSTNRTAQPPTNPQSYRLRSPTTITAIPPSRTPPPSTPCSSRCRTVKSRTTPTRSCSTPIRTRRWRNTPYSITRWCNRDPSVRRRRVVVLRRASCTCRTWAAIPTAGTVEGCKDSILPVVSITIRRTCNPRRTYTDTSSSSWIMLVALRDILVWLWTRSNTNLPTNMCTSEKCAGVKRTWSGAFAIFT